jgi:superfamily II DNA or RNA helicase/HKD family nuclease
MVPTANTIAAPRPRTPTIVAHPPVPSGSFAGRASPAGGPLEFPGEVRQACGVRRGNASAQAGLMTASKRELPDGVYEHLVTEALATSLAELPAARQIVERGLDPSDGHVLLARHLGQQVARALDRIPAAKRPAAQRGIVNELLRQLAAGDRENALPLEESVADPARILLAIHRGAAPSRPASPLAQSTLLTRNRSEPTLSHELNREIESADRIDAIVAFVTLGGIAALRRSLHAFARRGTGTRMRLLTTVFSGTTDAKALEELSQLPGVEVKVSFDTRRTRLHAKAWLFHRNTGLHTGYVGSANLTHTALGTGQEWMVKLSAADLPHVIDKFHGTFESLWNDEEFESVHLDNEELIKRLRLALSAERRDDDDETALLVALRPFPFQEEILDRLAAQRLVHDRWRNLLVAATGTGKTVVAAFDYARQMEGGVAPRLLLLAHREELVVQARETFRHALRDRAFGEILTGGRQPAQWDHVFATIQSAARADLVARFGAEHFRFVVVDECHHVPADSYQALVPKLQPRILLGLTATPERMDGKSLLPDFDGHVAAELRLWHALERQLLVPFEYYGISDGTDLSRLKWRRAGYDLGQLSGVYTGDHARVDLMVKQLQDRVADVRSMRAVAFCVSVEHAQFVAAQLTARGIPAEAIHGQTPAPARKDAPRRLRERECNVLCTCDLYNEGVDLPFVDVLLLLRPTNSATLFMQQLGRGLRTHPDKSACLVLDFIGVHRAEFRFDGIFAALTGIPRATLTKAVEQSFPYLPSGCVLQLDTVAQAQVLSSLRQTLGRAQRLAEEAKEVQTELGHPPTLAEFLEATGREVADIYRGKDGSWTRIRRRAGLLPGDDAPTEELARRLGWLLHVDERRRLRAWVQTMDDVGRERVEQSELYARRMAMLDFQLRHRGIVRDAAETARYLAEHPAVDDELRQLAVVLDEQINVADEVYPVPDWPLALHRHYSRREILAAVGYVRPGDKGKTPQGGILKLADRQAELLLVTLDKSGTSFSPSTRYKDYAVSRELFHWETQSIASVSRPSGLRYVESPANGWSFFLFVRETPDDAYAFVGPARYRSHEGDRPISITWKLDHPLPAALFGRYATLASG